MATGTFITVLDQSATAIVTPKIAEEFGSDIPTAQWLAIGYMLSVSALMMPAGALSDLIGRKTAWLTGLSIFVLSSALASLAPSFGSILTAKIIMGIGASAVQANGMAMIASAFDDDQRGKALGLHMTVVGIGAIGGPIIGGGIDGVFGWRAIFMFTSLFSLLAIVIALLILTGNIKRIRPVKTISTSFDWVGACLSAVGLVGLMLSITFASNFGWLSVEIVGGLTLTILSAVGFVLWEMKFPMPMLPLSMFKSTVFSAGALARFLSFVASSATFFLMPFFLVSSLGISTAQAAVYLLPGSICMAVFGPISGRMSDSVGPRRPAVLGMSCAIAGVFIFSMVNLDTNLLVVSLAAGLSGTGMSVFMAPNTSAMMGSVSRSRYGIVSAFLNLNRNSAHVVGVAIPTAVVVGVMASHGYEADLSDPNVVGNLGLRKAYVQGMSRAFQISTILMIISLLLCLIPGGYRRSSGKSKSEGS